MVGVVALRIRFQMHADDLVLAQESTHFVTDVLPLPALEHLIAHGGIFRLLFDEILVNVQNACQISRQKINIHVVLRQLQRIEEDVFHARGGRENVHVAVIDRAA